MEPEILNTYYQSNKKVLVTPLSALQHQTPIVFYVPGSDSLWMDLYNSYFQFHVKMVTPDGVAVTDSMEVGPINNLLHSLFSSVEVELGGKAVSDQNGLNPIRSYLDTILYSGMDFDSARHELEGFKLDTSSKMKEFNAKDGPNKGLVFRANMLRGDAGADVVGKLKADIFNMNSPIIPGVSLKIKLVPSKDNFMLMATKPTGNNAQVQYQIRIESARFHLKLLEPSNAFAVQTDQSLSRVPWRYYFTRKTLKHFTIPVGQTSSLIDNMYLGPRPDRIFIVLVSDASLTGGYQQNPFNFDHSSTNYLSLTYNGTPIMDSPYTPDFANGKYIKEMHALYETLGKANATNKSLAIARSDYPSGFAIFGFDLTTDNNPLARDPPRNGTVRLELKFATATSETINVVVMGEFPAYMEIDKYRNVVTNF